MIDIRKTYAHVFFDRESEQLKIAVYATGKIPGFSGALGPELSDRLDSPNAFKAFNKILKNIFKPTELQLGALIKYSDIASELVIIEKIGKILANNPAAKIIVDIDDSNVWFKRFYNSLPDKEKEIVNASTPEEIEDFKKEVIDEEFFSLMRKAEDMEQLEDAFKQIYIKVARTFGSTGPKDVMRSTPPPTFIISKKGNLAYYPGFRGAQNMPLTPEGPSFHIYPPNVEKEQKWFKIIIPDCQMYTDRSIKNINIEELDYVTETLAKIFFNNLQHIDNVMSFNKALIPVELRAKEMLKKLSLNQSTDKKASQLVGTWIDLESGQIFDSEEQLIAAIKHQPEPIAKAAKLNLTKIAIDFYKKGNKDLFNKIIRKIK